MEINPACVLVLFATALSCSTQTHHAERDRRHEQQLGKVTVITVSSSTQNIMDACSSAHLEQLSRPDAESKLYFIFAARTASDVTALYSGLQVDETSVRDHFLWYRSMLGKVKSRGSCELIAHGRKVLAKWKNDDEGHSSSPRALTIGALGLGAFTPEINECELITVKFDGDLNGGESTSFATLYLRHPSPRIMARNLSPVRQLIAALGWARVRTIVSISSSGFAFMDTQFPLFLPSVKFDDMTGGASQGRHYEEHWFFPPSGTPRLSSSLNGVGM